MAIAKPNFGVYTPLVTFFNEDESIDFESTLCHAKRMADGGVAGLVLQGSNGEAPHLDHEERKTLVHAVRNHLNSLGYLKLHLIVGCGAASVRETLVYISQAKESGAEYALVLPPAYWVAAMNASVIEGFFRDVAAKSELPVLIYNFPGVTGGIDISSDSIIRLAQETPKIIGCKLTCGNVGKLQRISSTLPAQSFSAFGGKSDFFLPALVAGSNGIIAALANIVPKAHVELLRLYEKGDLKAAQLLQTKLSHADWALTKVGIAGVKAIVSHHFGYGTGRGRRPLGNSTVEALSKEIVSPIQEVIDLEKKL
ncbi:putative dihydrodipicolinate synthase [Talaromyces proteolyticus]|uniref:Dihydrodipicolinate synthase n=1 Tax=Talaromyces proteolyticus TaxID=1131652 RepID=A0AAD4L4J5_9EURO|nr:putative dihydrodipicolinate synthase [Talaromyces proteolyticus]KAH8704896.1 putative dihydrodipicolinate synthase [Talaromyces proteolyticus]